MLSYTTKNKLIAGIRQANRTEKVVNWDDKKLSFCVSKSNERLCISVGELSNKPNVSALPFLTQVLGPVDEILYKTSGFNPNLMIAYMKWNNPKKIK